MKKVYLYILLVLSLIIIVGILYYVLKINKTPSNANSNNSNQQNNIQDNQDYPISFSIDSILVNPAIPAKLLSFSTKTKSDDLSTSKINKNTVKIGNENIQIYVISGLGESGGIYKFNPPYTVVVNLNITSEIARINSTDCSELYFTDYIGQLPSDKKLFFYTSTFGEDVSCVNSDLNQICSTQEIRYNDQNFGVCCLVTEDTEVSICDEFVKNLSLEIE